MAMLYCEDLLRSLKGEIVIVGNGPINKGLGKLIDQHNIIFRFNNYQINGFEELVGTRTSFRVVSTWRDLVPYNNGIELCPFPSVAPEACNRISYENMSSVPILYAKNDFRKFVRGYSRPSTGLAFLVLLSALDISVNVAGFRGCKNGYYWDRKDRRNAHNPRLEAATLGQLKNIKFLHRI